MGGMKNFITFQVTGLKGYILLCLLLSPLLQLSAEPSAQILASEPGTERQQELQYLLKQDCGSCHGLRLKGGLGPPLLQEALKGKPKLYLKQVISKGIPGSAMPPWENLLSDNDIDYLVQLLSTQPSLGAQQYD